MNSRHLKQPGQAAAEILSDNIRILYLKLPKIDIGFIFLGMKTQALNVNLTVELRRYLKEQVRAGRYQNENEVVRDAIRQMQQRELEQFERLFGDYPGAPSGEPTAQDDKAIQAAIHRHRDAGLNGQAP
jgi:putative addiction module CopG family antidote